MQVLFQTITTISRKQHFHDIVFKTISFSGFVKRKEFDDTKEYMGLGCMSNTSGNGDGWKEMRGQSVSQSVCIYKVVRQNVSM